MRKEERTQQHESVKKGLYGRYARSAGKSKHARWTWALGSFWGLRPRNINVQTSHAEFGNVIKSFLAKYQLQTADLCIKVVSQHVAFDLEDILTVKEIAEVLPARVWIFQGDKGGIWPPFQKYAKFR